MEVIGQEPDEPSQPSLLEGVLQRLGRGSLVLLVLALVVGGAAGAWLEHRVVRPAAAKPAPLPRDQLDAVVLIPAGATVTATNSSDGAVSDVEIALINQGPATLNDVEVQWQATTAEVGAVTEANPVSALLPGIPTTVQLPLWRPCTGGQGDAGSPPLLLVSWGKGGTAGRLAVTPLGLDRLWSALPSHCPSAGDARVNGLNVSHVYVVPAAGKEASLHLRFDNLGAPDLRITPVSFLAPGFTIGGVSPREFVAHANTTTNVTIGISVSNCRLAIVNASASSLTYDVSSGTAGPVSPTYSSVELSKALAQLVYRACAAR